MENSKKVGRGSIISIHIGGSQGKLGWLHTIARHASHLEAMAMHFRVCAAFLLAICVVAGLILAADDAKPEAVKDLVITKDTTLDKDATLNVRLIIKASNITIDGNGATLVGAGKIGDPKSL